MGMSIDEAYMWLRSTKEHYGEYHEKADEALDIAISTMRKYQKIKHIYQKWNEVNDFSYNQAMLQIGEVLKDGNDDC